MPQPTPSPPQNKHSKQKHHPHHHGYRNAYLAQRPSIHYQVCLPCIRALSAACRPRPPFLPLLSPGCQHAHIHVTMYQPSRHDASLLVLYMLPTLYALADHPCLSVRSLWTNALPPPPLPPFLHLNPTGPPAVTPKWRLPVAMPRPPVCSRGSWRECKSKSLLCCLRRRRRKRPQRRLRLILSTSR